MMTESQPHNIYDNNLRALYTHKNVFLFINGLIAMLRTYGTYS